MENQIQFVATSPTQLANLISDQVRDQLESYAAKLQKASSPQGKEVMTRKETAQFFGVSLVTIHDWTKSGIIHPYKVGNRVYFKRSHLMDVLEQSNPKQS
jgi:excisionase family DNA binding protein